MIGVYLDKSIHNLIQNLVFLVSRPSVAYIFRTGKCKRKLHLLCIKRNCKGLFYVKILDFNLCKIEFPTDHHCKA